MAQANVITGPVSDVQREFLECPADEAGFFGGKKCGKSAMAVLLPVRHIQDPRFRCLILRRETPDLAYIEEVAKSVYKRACPSVNYNQTKKLFVFPHPQDPSQDGAQVRLGFCKTMSDAENYQGWKLQMLIFDELTQWESDKVYTTLAGELLAENDPDTGKPWMRPLLRATSNPMGRGASWVKKRFCIDKFPEGRDAQGKRILVFDEASNTYRAYFKATVFDNPTVNADDYVRRLKTQSEQRQRAMIWGEWVEESSAFTEFDPKIHVCDEFKIPDHWELYLSADWGYSTLFCAHLWAVNPDNRGAVCIAEWTLSRTHPIKCAEAIRERIERMGYSLDDISAAYIGGDAKSPMADGTGLSPIEHMAEGGIIWTCADRTREARFLVMVNRLTTMVERPDGTKVPSIRFMKGRCPYLLETLPILPKKEGEDDIDKLECKKANDLKGNDHGYDSATHFLIEQGPLGDVNDEDRDSAFYRRERMPPAEEMRPYIVGIPRGY